MSVSTVSYSVASRSTKTEISILETKQLEDADYANLPWPLDYKYVKLLKKQQEEEIEEKFNPFEECQRQYIKQKKGPNRLFNEALNEGDKLFNSVGYVQYLKDLLNIVLKSTPIPIDPNEYIKNIFIKKSSENDKSYNDTLRELTKLLVYEGILENELKQIKLLHSLLDEGNNNTDKQLDELEDIKLDEDVSEEGEALAEEGLGEVEPEVEEEEENVSEEEEEKMETEDKQTIVDGLLTIRGLTRQEALQDIKLWKKYQKPVIEDFIRQMTAKTYFDDGRCRELSYPDIPNTITAEKCSVPNMFKVYEKFDDEDEVKEEDTE